MVIGAAIAIPCGVVAGEAVKNSLKIQAVWGVPGTLEVHLASGQWEVYELTGTISGSSFGPFSYTHQTGGPVTIDSTDIQVTDPQGGFVPVRERFGPNSFQTYRTGSRIYTGVASFDPKAQGVYRISVANSGPGQVILARPPFAGLGRSLGWIVGGVTGAVVFVVGLVLLILDLDGRRRAGLPSSATYTSAGQWGAPSPVAGHHHPHQPASTPSPGLSSGGVAPGWHPDPSGRYQYRYWDGAAWTSHVSTGGVVSADPL